MATAIELLARIEACKLQVAEYDESLAELLKELSNDIASENMQVVLDGVKITVPVSDIMNVEDFRGAITIFRKSINGFFTETLKKTKQELKELNGAKD